MEAADAVLWGGITAALQEEQGEPPGLETTKHKVKLPRADTALTSPAVQSDRAISAAVTALQQGQRGHQFQLFCFMLPISVHMLQDTCCFREEKAKCQPSPKRLLM